LSTASRVLHGTAGRRVVAQELQTRVIETAKALRYVPNAHAQALAAGGTQAVGLITHDVGDPYFGGIARGAMRVATLHGTLVLLASTLRDPEQELAHVAALRAQRARAIVLTGSGFQDEAHTLGMLGQLLAFEASGGRVAMVSHHDLPFDVVLPDNRGGGAGAANHLLDIGHRRIAVVAGPRLLTTVSHRVDGFVEALRARNVLLSAGQVVASDFSEEGGYRGTVELLNRGLESTALFCASDVMAIGALQALKERGIRVPEDLSLVGFDDIPIMRQLTPALTTVSLPLERMGEAAMNMALGPGETRRRRVQMEPATVVVRESTAPPR
jgi:LacI family transcriptional regulator